MDIRGPPVVTAFSIALTPSHNRVMEGAATIGVASPVMGDDEGLIAEIADLAAGRNRIEYRIQQLVRRARKAGINLDEIVAATRLLRREVIPMLQLMRNEEFNPAQFCDHAPALVVPQPDGGLTVGIGTDPTQKPKATFTFDEEHPVLLLLAPDVHTVGARDVWPVIAASASVSDARVQVFGPLPHPGWDAPTYHGEWPYDTSAFQWECQSRIERINKDEEIVRPMLICLSYWHDKEIPGAVNTITTFGHRARIHLIIRGSLWEPRLATVNSVLAVGGANCNYRFPTFSPGLPNIPSRLDTAILTTPEGITEMVLPPNPAQQNTSTAQ